MQIESEMRPGDSIAPEPELERRFGVSRVTVRRAIDVLVQDGSLVRRQGSGTYVTQRKVVEELGVMLGWTESMRRQGLVPHTVDCEILRVVPPAQVAELLGQDPQSRETVVRVQRLRYADDEPLCLMTDYVAERFVPGLTEDGLSGESLYDALHNRYNLELCCVKDTVTARAATVKESALLGVSVGAPLLRVTRVTLQADGVPLVVAFVSSRADRYAYQVTGRTQFAIQASV